jgi:PhzF family phenazine biosynthesis protein
MKLPVYQIDTFAGRVFAGNPAVVCCLDAWTDDAVLTAIAAEHNISATSFLVDRGDAFDIRYFTPTGELPLVGHASLAAAHVVLHVLRPDLSSATLRRRGGLLHVSRSEEDMIAIQLPVVPSTPCAAPAGLAEALGARFGEVRTTGDRYFVLMESEAAIAALTPDMNALLHLDKDSVIVTARGNRCDFVSRAFAPKEGLPEDPVCGSAHLTLVPLWTDRLGRTRHLALQLSPRGGELHCSLEAGEVRLAGRCALYLKGSIHL